MPNARDIPWPRLIAESGAIVISILLAFSIDAWWTERQENAREEHQIEALITEFEGNRSNLDFDLDRLREITSNLEELSNKLSSVSEGNDVEVFDRYFWSVRQGGIVDPSTGTLDAMISSGDLGLLQNESVRSALSEWSAKLDEVQTDQLTLRNFTGSELIPYLGTLGDFSSLVLIRTNKNNAPDNLRTVQSTGRLRTSVAYKLLMSRVALGKLEILEAKTESIIELLKQSQTDVGS
jgi:hypothetical protein